MKKPPKKQRKSGRNPFNFYNIQIMKQVTMMITYLRNLVSAMLEAGMSYILETFCYWIINTWLNSYAT